MPSGLYKHTRRVAPGVSLSKTVYGRYKGDSRERGQEFSLSYEKFMELTSKDCYYCGTHPTRRYTNKRLLGEFLYNGLDRIDCSVGYVEENVVPCCTECNYAKGKMNRDEFLNLIGRIYNHQMRLSFNG